MLRKQLRISRGRQRMALVLAVVMAMPVAFAPREASAGIFDFLFNNNQPARAPAAQQQQPAQSSSFADPLGLFSNPEPAPAPAVAAGRFTTYCVRSCDGRYFPLTARGGSTPAQMCQAFCPASQTKVFSGNSIDYAVGNMGERYVDTPNAFAYRKALKADCTCNGRDPAGLAPVDLSLDTTLRPGDVVATANGLVAYSGVKTASGQTMEFTPVNSYPGLTADLRARLGEMKVTPVAAEMTEDSFTPPEITGSVRPQAAPLLPAAALPKITTPKAKRADMN